MKNLKKSIFILILLTFMLVGLFSGIVIAKERVVKIGLLFPRSGPLAKIGQEEVKSVKLAIQEINERGGILIAGERVDPGVTIKFVDYDSKDVDTGIACVEKMASFDKVDIIIGGTSSTLFYGESAKAASLNIPIFGVNVCASNITDRGLKNTWRVATTSREYGATAAMLIKNSAPSLGKKPEDLRVGVIYEDGIFGESVAKDTIVNLKKLGIPIVAEIPYDKGINDFTPIIFKLKNAKVDVVHEVSYVTDAILFRQQCRSLNFYIPILVGGANGTATDEYMKALGSDCIGVMTPMDSVINANEEYALGIKYFAKRWKEEFGEEVWAPYCIIGYETMQVVALILKEIVGQDLPINVETIEKVALLIDLPNYTLVTGHGLKFDSKTHQNLRNFAFGIQWQPDYMENSVLYEGRADGTPAIFAVYPEKLQMAGAEFGYIPLRPW